MDAEDAIGRRARLIRRRRGLGLDAAAGLAGISTSYLSRLERGERGFERRGLLEDLAAALGYLDTADRLAPQRIRNDPIARELVTNLHHRSPRRMGELDSLRNRFRINTSARP